MADTAKMKNADTLSRYLVTKPFETNYASDFRYSMNYGITDSAKCSNVLNEKTKIRCRIELIDASTQEKIGTFNDVEYSITNRDWKIRADYKVSLMGLGRRIMAMRMVIDVDGEAKYTITNKYADNSVFRIQKSGSVKQVSYQTKEPITSYELRENYPNPFNPSTTISYALPKEGMVMLKIYDALGSEVATLVNKTNAAGRYTAVFDASHLSSGMYIARMTAGNRVLVKKMSLIR